MGDDGFAGSAEEEGEAEGAEFAEAGEEGEVLGLGFGEADAGVEDEVGAREAGALGDLEGFFEEAFHATDEVVVGVGVGGVVVHDDDGGSVFGGEGGEVGVALESVDVVEEGGSGGEGGAGDGRFVGVDGEGDGGFCGEGANEGGGACDFFFGGNLGVAGAGGLAADVEEVGALSEEEAGVGEGGVEGEEASAVEEGIVGGVDDAHDAGRGGWKRAGHGMGQGEGR